MITYSKHCEHYCDKAPLIETGVETFKIGRRNIMRSCRIAKTNSAVVFYHFRPKTNPSAHVYHIRRNLYQTLLVSPVAISLGPSPYLGSLWGSWQAEGE